MKSKRDLEEIIAFNRDLEIKTNKAMAMAQEIQNQIVHDIPNMLALRPLLEMMIEYVRLLEDKTLKHGITMFSYGCRCDVCVTKKKEYRLMYDKVKEERKRK